jgi:hypothetical protein
MKNSTKVILVIAFVLMAIIVAVVVLPIGALLVFSKSPTIAPQVYTLF